VDLDQIPAQIRPVLRTLSQAISTREPAIRARVEALRARSPHLTHDQLALDLIRSTRKRVAITGAISGAASVAPGFGTALVLGTTTSQALFALEQETELVLAIAMIYGHELASSDDRLIEAIVVVGIASGAVKLREDVLVVGGEALALAAFRKLPGSLLAHGGGRILGRILTRIAASGLGRAAARVVPFAVGLAAGAGFDWLAVTGLGHVAMRYYGPGGPGALPLLAAAENLPYVEIDG